MIRKTLTFLTLIFFIQLLASCFTGGSCPDNVVRAELYDLRIFADYEKTKNQSDQLRDTLMVTIIVDGKELSEKQQSNNLHFGFNQSLAEGCDDLYRHINYVDSIDVFIKPLGGVFEEKTSAFYFGDYNTTIDEYFDNLRSNHEKPQEFEPYATYYINFKDSTFTFPDQIDIKVKAFLSDGQILEQVESLNLKTTTSEN